MAIAMVMVATRKKESAISPDAAYNALVNNLNNGPGDEYLYNPSNPETQERFYMIAGEILNTDEQTEYYNSLEEDYSALRDGLQKSDNELLRGFGKELEEMFPIHFAMVRQSEVNEKLFRAVAYDNDTEADEIISKIANLAHNNPISRATKTAQNFAEYLKTTRDLYKIYQIQGCIQLDELALDAKCVNNLSDDRVLELQQQAKNFLGLTEINSGLLSRDFYKLLEKIKQETEKNK